MLISLLQVTELEGEYTRVCNTWPAQYQTYICFASQTALLLGGD